MNAYFAGVDVWEGLWIVDIVMRLTGYWDTSPSGLLSKGEGEAARLFMRLPAPQNDSHLNG